LIFNQRSIFLIIINIWKIFYLSANIIKNWLQICNILTFVPIFHFHIYISYSHHDKRYMDVITVNWERIRKEYNYLDNAAIMDEYWGESVDTVQDQYCRCTRNFSRGRSLQFANRCDHRVRARANWRTRTPGYINYMYTEETGAIVPFLVV